MMEAATPATIPMTSNGGTGDYDNVDDDMNIMNDPELEGDVTDKNDVVGMRDEHADERRAKNIKDLELPSFTPTPRASVSTWVDRIDLALKGVRESGRGEWSDLALLRRYGPRVDKSAAEARVNARYRFKDEPYADFAAVLQEAADRNEVSERVFLAQFYRCIDRTLRQLVKQPPRPVTLEEALEKAIEIDDPMDYAVPTMLGVNQLAPPDLLVCEKLQTEMKSVNVYSLPNSTDALTEHYSSW
ncbi:hypothetical protein PHMEG_00029740 [Phytophthora megakarya]|uniref:Uncharacterized protein n=1 Tax=Phytophthora megakarya TaxID=4795 RepID=A0A225V2C0_9STRA|nr:hypothetical protein PHMEG_00029740 [Phytophthora megakarya]